MFKIYMNIPRPLRCRAAGTWPPGSGAAGAYPHKKKMTKNCRQVPGDRSPGSGAAGPPLLYIRCWLPLTPSFALLKIQKKKKREGGREGEEG